MKGAFRLWITGPPGVGKTTLVERAVEAWTRRGGAVRGFFTREIREGQRVGFELVLLPEGMRFLLAHIRPIGRARLGRYYLSFGGLQAALAHLNHPDPPGTLVVVDEVGPMELRYTPFREWVQKAILPPLFLGTFQQKLKPVLEGWGCLKDAHIIHLTRENREMGEETVLRMLNTLNPQEDAHG